MASAEQRQTPDENSSFETARRDGGTKSRRSSVDIDAPLPMIATHPGRKRSRLTRAHFWWFLPVTALVAAIGYQMGSESTYFTSYAANAIFRHNFHSVIPGRFYRSAQMPRDALAETIREHGIRTVIDLRLNEDAPDESGTTFSVWSPQDAG